MMNEFLTGIQDVIQVCGQLSLGMIVALTGAEITNRLIKKVYPKFNPKTSWTSQGSMIQALPSIIVAGFIALYIGSKLRNYQFPNVLIPLAAIIVFYYLFIKKSWTKSRN